jgi:hypothetical protein
MSPKPDIRCETAYCSISCTDAALPPQEVAIDMLLFHDSYMYTVIVSMTERNGRCNLRTEPLTNDRPTKFRDPNVTVRYVCVGDMLADKKQSFNSRSVHYCCFTRPIHITNDYCILVSITANHCQSLPITAKHCQTLPITAKHCQSLPFNARHADLCWAWTTSLAHARGTES